MTAHPDKSHSLTAEAIERFLNEHIITTSHITYTAEEDYNRLLFEICNAAKKALSPRCAQNGHVWVGTGDERVVCDDCGVQKPRFENVSCSQCGMDFGPGDAGYSNCCSHMGKAPLAATPQKTGETPRTAEKRLIALNLGWNRECIWEWAEQLERETTASHVAPNRPRITTMPLLKRLREQRDEVAQVVREIRTRMQSVHAAGQLGQEIAEKDRAWLAQVDAALAKCPTYEQQLRYIAEGIGMSYDELIAAVNNRADGGKQS